jgi:hypothetical protein
MLFSDYLNSAYKKNNFLKSLFFFFLFLYLFNISAFISPAFSRIFKYVDQHGVTHLTNQPRENEKPERYFDPVKLKEPYFEVKGSWDLTNQAGKVFNRIYDRLHKKRLLDEEEMREIAEQKKKEEEERLKKEAENKKSESGGDGTSETADATAQKDTDQQKGDEKAEEKPEFIKAWWGLQVKNMTAADAKKLGLPDNNGVLISAVYPNSPAASAAIDVGQVIVEARAGNITTPINSVSDFASLNLIIDQSVQVSIEDPVTEMANFKHVIIKNIPDKDLANDWY